MKRVGGFSVALALALGVHLLAQPNPSLAGRWTIDRSGAPAGRGRGGIAGIPIATMLVVRVSRDAVIVDADTGSGQAIQTSVFKLDGTANDVPGPLGWETKATAQWQGDALVVTTRRSMTGPTGPMSVDVKDVYTASGDTLTIDRSMGRATQKLTYRRGESK